VLDFIELGLNIKHKISLARSLSKSLNTPVVGFWHVISFLKVAVFALLSPPEKWERVGCGMWIACGLSAKFACFCFSVNVPNGWNSLQEPAVQVNSVNCFKNQLEKLRNNQMDFYGQIVR